MFDKVLHRLLTWMKINTVEPMAEANSETCQTSKMERFAKIVNDF